MKKMIIFVRKKVMLIVRFIIVVFWWMEKMISLGCRICHVRIILLVRGLFIRL